MNGSKNCEIHAPLLRLGGGAKTITMNAIPKNILFYSRSSGCKTVGMIVISIEHSAKSVKFMATGSGALVLGRGSVKYIVKVHYFFKKSFPLQMSILQMNLEDRYDKEECLSPNYEFHGPWVVFLV